MTTIEEMKAVQERLPEATRKKSELEGQRNQIIALAYHEAQLLEPQIEVADAEFREALDASNAAVSMWMDEQSSPKP